MQIGSIQLGRRSNQNVIEEPQRWYTAGVSQAAVVTMLDFGHSQQDINIDFETLSLATKDSLKSYLINTVGQYGSVSVTPDPGDDLGVGASGAISLTFVSFMATRRAFNIWQVNCLFRRFT